MLLRHFLCRFVICNSSLISLVVRIVLIRIIIKLLLGMSLRRYPIFLGHDFFSFLLESIHLTTHKIAGNTATFLAESEFLQIISAFNQSSRLENNFCRLDAKIIEYIFTHHSRKFKMKIVNFHLSMFRSFRLTSITEPQALAYSTSVISPALKSI